MSTRPVIVGGHLNERRRLLAYVTGFVLSLILTIIPYQLVTANILNGWFLTGALVVFALLQLIVQLQFFIHLGHESGTPWNKLIFMFMVLIVFIIVAGSLWIMNNLDYRHSQPRPKNGSDTPSHSDDYPHYDRNFNPTQTNNYIIQDEGFKHQP